MAEGTKSRVAGALRSIRRGTDDELANPKIAAAAVLLLILIPVLPFLAVAWMISKTLNGVRKRVSWE